MARIVTPGSNSPAVHTALSAHHYRLLGLELCPRDANVAAPGDLLQLGDGSIAQNSLDLVAHDFIVDRCYIHGNPAQSLRRGIRLNSATTDITNCDIRECHQVGADSQAIAGWNGPGPYNIINCELQGAAENIIFGGADPFIANLIPSDITIRGCHFFKPLSWRVGDPSYAGINWAVKNLFEIKNAQRVILDDNLFENCWAAAQAGAALSLKAVSQSGLAPWSACSHIIVTRNRFRAVNMGLLIAGQTNPCYDITVRFNLWEDLSGARWGAPGATNGVFAQLSNCTRLTIANNTADNDGMLISFAGVPGDMPGMIFTDNVAPLAGYGIKGAGQSSGLSSLATYAPGATFSDNVLIGPSAQVASYPSSNTYAETMPVSLGGAGYVTPPPLIVAPDPVAVPVTDPVPVPVVSTMNVVVGGVTINVTAVGKTIKEFRKSTSELKEELAHKDETAPKLPA